MGMYSKQELDVNVRVLEDKVEFIMKSFNINNPLDPFGQPKSLLQVYYEVKSGVPLAQSVGNREADEPASPNDVVSVTVEETQDVSVDESKD